MSVNPFRKRVPFVPQMEVTECGAASLGMVLAHHACHVPLAELRAACGVSRDGASALDVVKAARRYGLVTKALKVERVERLGALPLPAILHWEFNHFLVLERIDHEGADLVDPAFGRRRVSRRELERAFTGVAVTALPGPGFATRRRVFRGAATYRRLLDGALPPLLVTTASALLLEALGLFIPAASGFVVDFVIRPRQERWLGILAVAFALFLVLRAALQIGRERILGGIEARLEVGLSAALVKHLVSLPTAFFAQRGVGDLLHRVSALLAARETFSRVLVAGFDLVLVGAYGALMVLYDLRLGGAVVLLQLLAVAVTVLARRRGRPAAATRQIASARAQAALVHAFADPETSKAFGAEGVLLERYAAARAHQLNANVDVAMALEPSQHALAILGAVSSALVLGVGGEAVLGDRMTLGTLTSFLALQTLLGPPLQRVVQAFQDLADLGPILDRVDDVFETAPEPTGTWAPERVFGAITFENVSFRYGTKGPMLLDDVSFHIAPGERVAFVGASGVGKSTILKLLLGFVKPSMGRILIDGRDLADFDLGALRSSIGAVLAGGSFFEESVFDNVALGSPEATLDDVRDALSAACAEDVVEGLPRGALTCLGTGATRLSGGQRQRLLLARALARRPSMLLLDEASSALDAGLEERIQTALAEVPATMVIVAHRPSAVALADRVLVLDKGRVVPAARNHHHRSGVTP